MAEDIIIVKDLKKVFRVPEKDREGFKAAIRLLLKRKYKYITAVDGLNMRIKKGEIRGLIGPNGAGKSTTIKMISGILYPTEGAVEAMGYTPWLQREEYVRNIGVVLGQKSQLLWDLPAIDSFSLNKEIYKIPEDTYRENIDYFKHLLDIEEVINKPVRNLSLGERMKCELVCALLHNPELVYLDEPTIGLDVFAKESIRNYIKQINRQKGITFLLTTHDLNEVENLCGNVTVINNGVIVYNGLINDLRALFSDRKIIEVKFSGPVDDATLGKFNVVDVTPASVKIEVDLSQNKIRDEVDKIFGILPVHDINIENVSIEEVIKEIYRQ